MARTDDEEPSAALPVRIPEPPADLGALVTVVTWRRDTVIHRVHLDDYAGDAFNPGSRGNARFSPIRDLHGRSIPTLYGGTTFDCAAMETVFHDVPFTAGLKTFDRALKLAGQVYTQIVPQRDLHLADLSATALRKLGIARNQLIDTEKDIYPQTRAWAAAIHRTCPKLDGLSWVSRQDDRARALMLFGDRMRTADLHRHGETRSIQSDLAIHNDLLRLADRIGVRMI
jgi:hypothetical protein